MSRRIAAYALVVAMAGSSACVGGSERREGATGRAADEPSQTTSTTAGQTGGGAGEQPQSPPNDGRHPGANGNGAPSPPGRKTVGTIPPDPGKPIDVGRSERQLTYIVYRSEEIFKGRHLTLDVRQQVLADKITLRWQGRNNEGVEEWRELKKAGTSWTGAFFETWSHDWASCAYSPAATYVPHPEVGARQAIDSRCRIEESRPGLGDSRDVHVVGEVAVTGTREVTVAGQPHRALVIERHFKTFADGEEDETWITDLWSPEALAVLKHDVRVKGPRGEAVIRTEIAGFKDAGG